ncbi:Na+/H+ antiporter NhaC family protein [Anaerotignum sp.]|uniref:Na+/H+ antiporter NhaC family protein n=1 Tax=Anaerotignum sp. TaxID=2039241 RepID=UPI00373707B3
MEESKKQLKFRGSHLCSLIPLIIFVGFCIGFFVVFKVFEMEALCMGGILALMIGSFWAKNWTTYWESVVKGMASPMMNTLALVLLVVGIFAKLMSRGGVAQGFVWLGDSLGLQGGLFVVFTFIATSIISMATGSSIGTLFSGFPILYPSGILLGADPLFLAGAILSGAIFGDNVAPISDTTIASAASQEFQHKKGTADVGGVVSTRMKYALVAMIIACILFWILGRSGETDVAGREILEQYMDARGLIMLIPVVILLTVAVKKRDIFIAVTWGIISGTVIGLTAGIIGPKDIISVADGTLQGFAIDGIKSMLGTVGYLYAIAGIMGVLNESGTMDKIINGLLNSKLNQTVIGSELIMGIGIIVSSICLGAANGPAIIMFGPIANKIGKAKDLHPYRRANLLDGFASTIPVIIPFTSSFIFIVITCVNSLMEEYSFIEAINPIRLSFSSFHCIALFFVFLLSVFTGWGREYEGPNGERMKKNNVK